MPTESELNEEELPWPIEECFQCEGAGGFQLNPDTIHGPAEYDDCSYCNKEGKVAVIPESQAREFVQLRKENEALKEKVDDLQELEREWEEITYKTQKRHETFMKTYKENEALRKRIAVGRDGAKEIIKLQEDEWSKMDRFAYYKEPNHEKAIKKLKAFVGEE